MTKRLAGLLVGASLALIVVAALLSFSGATLAGSMVPARDGLHRTHKMLEQQRDTNEHLTQRLKDLGTEEHVLETDPWVTKRILVESTTDEPREFEVNLEGQVSWIDRSGEMLRTPGTVIMPPMPPPPSTPKLSVIA